MKCSLGISNFLEEISHLSRSIVFLYFFALMSEEGFLISPCCSLELFIQMGISFFSPLPFAYLLFSEICKGSSDNHFASFCFFFLVMVLITACCAVSGTSVTLGSLPLGLWVGRGLCAAVALPWCLLHPLFCGWAGWALGCYVRAFGWKVLFSTVGVRVVFPHIPHCGRVSCCVETSLHSLLPP